MKGAVTGLVAGLVAEARTAALPRQRRHTRYFLEEARAIAPVFLDTEVDMTGVNAHRDAMRPTGRPYSVVTYVLHGAARVLSVHPDANAAVRGRRAPRIARYPGVHGKVAFDKTVGGRRVVLSAVLPDLQEAGLADVQRQIDHYRDGDPETMPEFGGARLLHALPWPVGPLVYRLGVRPLARRPAVTGTFAVSSLGHRPVGGFYSVGGTTITLGLGRVTDRPVARDGAVEIAPLLPLSLAFDHRVIDGAEAADVLTEIKTALESYRAPEPGAAVPAEITEAAETAGRYAP